MSTGQEPETAARDGESSETQGTEIVNIAIVEDDPILMAMLRETVSNVPGFNVIGTAGTLAGARQLLESDPPNILLLDLGLPDGSGLELLAERRERPADATKVIVISVFGDVRNVVRAIEDGANGYLLKDATPTDLTNAIRIVLDGGAPLSPAIASHILQRLQSAPRRPATRPAAVLTPREVQVLELLAAGKPFKEVASAFQISLHTVADHVQAIYRKLSVNSRGEAVFKALQSGLIDLAPK